MKQLSRNNQIDLFERQLSLTPQPWITRLLCLANLLVFIIMVTRGVSPFQPAAETLLNWGASYGPLFANGEYWRILSAAFLHGGLLHLVLNLFCLISLGSFLERLIGRWGFLTIYLLSAIGGSLCSLAWQPLIVSVGASGAIFGICGGVLGAMLRGRGQIPPLVLAWYKNQLVTFIGYNLLGGFIIPHVDNAAHIGGLITGFFVGVILGYPRPKFTRVVLTFLIVLILSGALATQVAKRVPKPTIDWQAVLIQFIHLESQALQAYINLQREDAIKSLSDEEFARRIESEIVPKWIGVGKVLEQNQPPPPELQERIQSLKSYCETRAEGIRLRALARRDGDVQMVHQADALLKEADMLAEKLKAEGALIIRKP